MLAFLALPSLSGDFSMIRKSFLHASLLSTGLAIVAATGTLISPTSPVRAAWQQDSGYRIPAEFVIVSAMAPPASGATTANHSSP